MWRKTLGALNFCDQWIAVIYRPAVRDNCNLKSHKYVCVTTYHLDTKSNREPNPTTKQHAIRNIHYMRSRVSYISR